MLEYAYPERPLSRQWAWRALAVLESLFVLIPALPVAYLLVFQNPPLLYDDHGFHMIAIGLAMLEGIFISAVSWRCYMRTG